MRTPRRPATVTLHDVAREAGVSLATASRSLNGSPQVNEAYRQRVLSAAARLNYSPNLSARAVVRGTTTTVALLVADIADPYFSSITSGVVAEADREGLIVTLAVTDRDTRRELELLRELRGQRPRVIIVAGTRPASDPTDAAFAEELTAYEAAGGLAVVIGRNELGLRTMPLDNRAGAEALGRELTGIGYRRFAVISDDEGLLAARDRLDGFRAGISDGGGRLDDADIVRAAFTRDGGYEGARRLLERGLDGVELLFAVNDVMAVGALSAIRAAGLVPGPDLAVAGFDDIPTLRDVAPTLTSVRIPLEELGRRALRTALDRDAGAHAEVVTAVAGAVTTEVLLRDSTPPLR